MIVEPLVFLKWNISNDQGVPHPLSSAVGLGPFVAKTDQKIPAPRIGVEVSDARERNLL